MITEQIHQFSGSINVYLQISRLTSSVSPCFCSENVQLSTWQLVWICDSDIKHSQAIYSRHPTWLKLLFVINKSHCRGQQSTHEKARRHPTCCWNDIRGQKLSFPLTVIDTFGEGKNKVQLCSVIQPLIWRKLLPAVGAQLPYETMMSHNVVTNRPNRASNCTKKAGMTQCVPALCLSPTRRWTAFCTALFH